MGIKTFSRIWSSSGTRSRVGLLILLCLCFAQHFIPQLAAQEAPADRLTDAKIRGVVINKLTGEPIGRALVYSPDNRYAAMTGNDGRFEFTIPKSKSAEPDAANFRFNGSATPVGGPSALMARKPGFLEDPEKTGNFQTPGSDVRLTLIPEAIIRGRVLISNTEPAGEINVQLFIRTVQEGLPRWMPSGISRSNSQGEFRFAELSPGAYKVMTMETLDRDPVNAAPAPQLFGFPSTCFPGVDDFAAASVIQLIAGQTVQADIPLSRQPYFKIQVPVLNPQANQAANVSVVRQGRPGPGYSLAYSPETHQVEGLLPNGTYNIEMITYGSVQESGAVRITVAGAAVEGPALTLIAAGSVPVNVREEFTSTTDPNLGRFGPQSRGPSAYLGLWLEPLEDFSQRGGNALRPTGNSGGASPLFIENVQPGRYWVRFAATRGYVQSLTSGGVDLMHEPLVVSGAAHAPIEVVMRDDAAMLDGTIMSEDSAQRATDGSVGSNRTTLAYIYCVPLPDSDGQFAQFSASTDGSFASPPLAPGAYRVLAFAHPRPMLPYRDADAMRTYETQGTVVTLTATQKQHLQLQLISGE